MTEPRSQEYPKRRTKKNQGVIQLKLSPYHVQKILALEEHYCMNHAELLRILIDEAYNKITGTPA
jgi:hypothetical protein